MLSLVPISLEQVTDEISTGMLFYHTYIKLKIFKLIETKATIKRMFTSQILSMEILKINPHILLNRPNKVCN